MPIQVTPFTYGTYAGGMQNWGIAVDGQRAVYVGNSNGLLRFNGLDWQLLRPDGQEQCVRAVCPVGNRVYSAGDNNLGYWLQNSRGQMEYTSLLPLAQQAGVKGETFWSIAEQNGKVFFHTFANILCYDGKRMKRVVKDEGYTPLMKTGGKLFAQRFNSDLMVLSDRGVRPYSDRPNNGVNIKFFFLTSNNDYILGLDNGELWFVAGNGDSRQLVKLKTLDNHLVRIDCGAICEGRYLAVGTIGDGVFVLDLKTGQQRNIYSELPDLNVHGVAFASRDQLWLSLDNGVAAIDLRPTIWQLQNQKATGVFFDAALWGNNLYLATNRGLFMNASDRRAVDYLFPLQFSTVKGQLLCGTTQQLMTLNASGATTPLCPVNGVRQMEYLSDQGEEYLFLRGYGGLSLMKWNGSSWQFVSTVIGTEDYSEILPENLHTVWCIHPEKGISRVHIDASLTKATATDRFAQIDGYNNFLRTSMVRLDNNVYFATPKGFYLFDRDRKQFVRQEALSREIIRIADLQQVRPAEHNRLWVVAQDELFLYQMTDGHATLLLRQPFLGNNLMWYDKHFNLRSINDSLAFISTGQGTVVMNIPHAIQEQKGQAKDVSLHVESISYESDGVRSFVELDGKAFRLPSDATNIQIRLACKLRREPIYLSYRLTGVMDSWSDWQKTGIITFTNLPAGAFSLELRTDRQQIYTFRMTVSPPFYATWWAFVLYVLLLVGAVAYLVLWLQRRKRRLLEQELAETKKRNEEERQRLAYEQLQEKAKAQENDLKTNVRYLTQKQELIDAISTEVTKQKMELGTRYPNKLYDRLIKILQDGSTEKDRLLSYENYFVDQQHDFMLRLQQAHPELSSSELRFACLLRSNISTKEIAAVMNIAVRSVELKKYRLKQKLSLGKDDSLTNYILLF